MFFFGLFVEDGALFGVTAFGADIGFTLEAEDRLSQILGRVYQNHLCATDHTAHDEASPLRKSQRFQEAASAEVRTRTAEAPWLGAPLGLGGSVRLVPRPQRETAARATRAVQLRCDSLPAPT